MSKLSQFNARNFIRTYNLLPRTLDTSYTHTHHTIHRRRYTIYNIFAMGFTDFATDVGLTSMLYPRSYCSSHRARRLNQDHSAEQLAED